MPLRDDERAQAIQVGAVLLFAVLIIAFATYQAFVVPDQNREIEFNHNEVVHEQLQNLRNAIVSMVGGGSTQSVSVDLGVRYPGRAVAINPGPATGTLRTVGTTDPRVNATITNASTDGETGDFWSGATHNYTTGGLVYQPNYNVYQAAPTTVYENSVLYNVFRSGNVTMTGQSLVSGDRITLVTLNGTMDVGRSGTASVDLRPVSTSTRTVTVTNASTGENVTVTVPTQLNESRWEDLLDGEFVDQGGHVYEVTTEPLPGTPFQLLHVRLEPGVTYNLQLARVGVGTRVRTPDPAYLTTVSGNGTAVPEGSTQRVVVEVRDTLNNPVTGVLVNASADSGSVDPVVETSDGDGQVVLTYEAPANIDGNPEQASLNVSFAVSPGATSSFDRRAPENVTVDLEIQNTDGSGTGSGGGAYDVNWVNASAQPGGRTSPSESCSQVPCDPLPLRAETSLSGGGFVGSFWTNDTDVAEFESGVASTNTDGNMTARLLTGSVGKAWLYAGSGDGNVDDQQILETYLNSSFESGLGQWESFGSFYGGGTASTSSAYSNLGSQSAHIDDGDDGGIRMQSGVNTSGTDLIVVEYWLTEDDPEDGEGEDIVVEYLRAGGNPNLDADWVRIDRFDPRSTRPIYERRARIDAHDAYHDDFRLRFRQLAADASSDDWYVDDVTLSTIGNNSGRRASGGGGGGGGSGSLSYNSDATAVDQDGDNTPAGVQFSVTNNFGQNLRITDVTIDPANTDINRISDQRMGEGQWFSELHISSDVSDGLTDIGGGTDIPPSGLSIDLSQDGFEDSADFESETSPGGTATFHLYRFLDQAGSSSNYNEEDMTGENVDITIQYELADGTTGSTTFTVTPS